jgi:hypothetical protein
VCQHCTNTKALQPKVVEEALAAQLRHSSGNLQGQFHSFRCSHGKQASSPCTADVAQQRNLSVDRHVSAMQDVNKGAACMQAGRACTALGGDAMFRTCTMSCLPFGMTYVIVITAADVAHQHFEAVAA